MVVSETAAVNFNRAKCGVGSARNRGKPVTKSAHIGLYVDFVRGGKARKVFQVLTK